MPDRWSKQPGKQYKQPGSENSKTSFIGIQTDRLYNWVNRQANSGHILINGLLYQIVVNLRLN